MSREGQPVTQSELARFGDIHPMQVSNVIKVLEVKAMIARTPAPRNALAKNVAITATVLAVLRAALPLMIADDGAADGSMLDELIRIETAGGDRVGA